MKVLLIILVLTIAIAIVSKKIFESKFMFDFTGKEKLKYRLSNEIYISNIIYIISLISIFIEIIVIAISFIITKL